MRIELPFVGASPNVKKHWAIRAKITKNTKLWVRSHCPRTMVGRARIIYTRVGRMMDQDNLAATAKPFIDGLKNWAIIDDSPEYIQIEFYQRKPAKGEKPHTIIEVYPISAEPE